MSSQLTLLFGSGISIHSKIAGTWEITNHILTGENTIRNSDGKYYFSVNGETDKWTSAVVRFLGLINNYIEKYNSSKKKEKSDIKPNYESIFYVVQQIYDDLLSEYENPALYPLIQNLRISCRDIFGFEFIRDFKELCKEAILYMYCIIELNLTKSPSTLDQFDLVAELVKKQNHFGLDIITLNHDTLLEQYFDLKEIGYADGFRRDERFQLPYWDDLFNSKKINLIKLHGSIDWYPFSTKTSASKIFKIKEGMDIFRPEEIDSNINYSEKEIPLFLAGTFNKMFNYLDDFYPLYKKFEEIINKTENLIISGYSFNDKGVNTKIVEWLV